MAQGTWFANTFGLNAPQPQQPATTQPNQALASASQIQNQLSKEKTQRLTSTYLTQGATLMDEPMTTSALLTGS